MPITHGDPEALPNMPYQHWLHQSPAVWRRVETMIRDGWFGRVQSFYAHTPIPLHCWLTYDCALFAQSLGAPVGRFFTAAAIIERSQS